MGVHKYTYDVHAPMLLYNRICNVTRVPELLVHVAVAGALFEFE